ncbi:hypothetical protein GU926_02065 [Nibribacter ruber]|uniref:Uncharacterized protein n=1 Tax=Nibribacter ruber TaxID=2698458 RepID=A0A6P1NXB1_9BACT|nr:hypothetical protein [Nibribacter ruber]QHL86291.1 hypothetical protein GU926_02065 [Nibribacter ruber]
MRVFNSFSKAYPLLLALVITLGTWGCSSSAKEFNFDAKTWKNDLSGCKGDRIAMAAQIETFRLKLLTRKEYVIRGLFGRPDAEELLERSQKIYIYYITPGPKCGKPATETQEQKALTVRFDALGKVREVMLHDSY